MLLKNKKILVTGANSGIGFAIAKQAIEEGAQVWIHGRNEQALEKAVADLGPNAKSVFADMTSVTSIESMAQKLNESGLKLDGLVINAGIGPFLPVSDVSEEIFDSIMNTNLKGAFFTIKSLRKLMANPSSIVLNGSVVAKKGLSGGSVYGASKAALRSLSRSLAAEFSPEGIRVNIVNPGPVDTPILDKQGVGAKDKEHLQRQYGSLTLLNRIASSEEIANMFLFLLADKSSYITGAEHDVDGGFAQI